MCESFLPDQTRVTGLVAAANLFGTAKTVATLHQVLPGVTLPGVPGQVRAIYTAQTGGRQDAPRWR